ncbi:MAG: pantetheine-phosphate adenylyltransferase [Actinomycetia bacterium]|nr:pantetheine-phosphate adenylyltransferase [Actinomycetes bacterium]MCP4963552.1 pantetheine-phosphate adenylyltransferase [Actinomycetes bacterium]
MALALYPGTFDPFHNGHLEIVEAAADAFDAVVVAAMRNPGKTAPFFSDDERMSLIAQSVQHLDKVEVVAMEGLVIDAATNLGASIIVKGLRGVTDFDTEMQMAQMNRHVSGIVTMFIPATAENGFIASRYIREISKMAGDVTDLVPDPVARALRERFL